MLSLLLLNYRLSRHLGNRVNTFKYKQVLLASSVFLLGTIFSQPSWAQSIKSAADGTNTTIKQNGNQFNITGGKLSGDRTNLFQSFSQFNLDQNQIANFLSQPNIKNILGRVVGGNASVINGLIKVTGSNANLFLINPAGIVFGTYAHLNVPASFTATTATGIGFGNNTRFNATGLNDYTSLVGNPESFAFNLNQPGSIINAGSLQVGTGQNIFLLGGNVINTGTLTSPEGNLTIAAVPGTSLVKVSQTGHLLNLEIAPQQGNTAVGITPLTIPELLTGHGLNPATGITVDSTGQISLTSSGVAIASGNLNVAGQTGGAVNVLGNSVNLINANINASGVAGGGQVLIGGNEHGQGTVPNAQSTFVDQNTRINADALTSGNGGIVIVWSDNNTVFAGKISAQGGNQSGNGGFVEVSGKQSLQYDGLADLRAANGAIGNLLLDPATFVIANSGGDITPTTVANQWNLADTTYSATTSLTVTDSITGNGSHNLTLDAPTINLNAPITNSSTGLLSGTTNNTTVNVGSNGLIQNGVDAVAIGGSVNLAANTYTVTQPATINKSLTVTGMGSSSTTVSGGNTTQVFNISGTTVNLNALTITNGNTSNNGGGIQVASGSTLNINNSTISNNSASQGGCIFNNGTVTINNSTISGNQSNSPSIAQFAYGGGGILNNGTLNVLGNSIISNNISAADGGGILNNGTATINNSTISGNQSNSPSIAQLAYGGGGIFNNGTLNVLSNSIISNNISAADGGGIFNNGIATIKDSTISGNQSNSPINAQFAYGGGGIFNNDTLNFLSNSIISNNISAGDGGGIFNNSGTATIKNSTISGNQSNSPGGGIYNLSGEVTINYSTISNNLTKLGVGDAIYSKADSTLSVMNSNIIDGKEGLVIDGSSSPAMLNNTAFSGQTVSYISLINGALSGSTLDATTVQFDGLTGVNATISQLFAIEDKLGDAVNDPTVGFIRIKANNVFVTPVSGSIQRGVDSASSGDTINVESGTYNDSTLDINKPVNLIFDGNGSTINGSLTTVANVGLNGILTASSFRFNSAVNLINALTLKTTGNISFSNTVDGAQNLNLTAGSDINFSGAVGSSTTLTGLTISNAANITSSNITTNGAVNLTSHNNITTGDITTNGYDINLNGVNISTGNINSSAVNGGGNITLLASNQLTAKNLNSSASIGNGGNVRIDPLNITVDTINAQGGTDGIGGTINISTSGFFRATGTFTDSNGTLASISTAGGAGSGDINIDYSVTIPFTVGDATNQGTAGAITSAVTNIIDPTLSFQSYIQGNISLNSGLIIPNLKEQERGLSLEFPLSSGEPDILTLDEIKRKKISIALLEENIETAVTLIEDLWDSEYIGYYGNEFTNDRSQDLQETPELQTEETIQAALKKIAHQTSKKPAIVYMFSQPDSLELIVITPEGEAIHKSVKAGNRKALRQLATQFRDKLFVPFNKIGYQSSSEKLYELLITPIESVLASEKIDTILFSVDSGLRSLPFAALSDGHQFLVEKYSLGIIPSVTLMDTRYNSLANARVLAMGASKFVDNNDLPGVALELPNIVQKFNQNSFFINDQFTISNLLAKRHQQPTQIIHLATHGYFKAGAPKNSYIQFWGQEKLRLDQIRQLGLKNPSVELFVLSACHTASGNDEVELGFAGLAVQAGVKSALASLWSVSDEGTLALMSEFYQRLKTTPIKAEALRQAQIAMIKGQVSIKDGQLRGTKDNIPLPPGLGLSNNLDLSHPYYWAAFTMIGSPW